MIRYVQFFKTCRSRSAGLKVARWCRIFVCLVWGFTSQSTAMVMSRWWVHLTTLFSGQAWLKAVKKYFMHIVTFTCNWQQPFLNQGKEENDWEIIPISISTKVTDRAGPLDLQSDSLYWLRYWVWWWSRSTLFPGCFKLSWSSFFKIQQWWNCFQLIYKLPTCWDKWTIPIADQLAEYFYVV